MQETIKEIKYIPRSPWHKTLKPDKMSMVTNNLWEIAKQLLPSLLAGRKMEVLLSGAQKRLVRLLKLF